MLRKLLPHVAIIITMMYFVFYFIDRVNPAMAFINNDITKNLLFALGLIAILESVWLIRSNRAQERRRQQRLQQRLESRRNSQGGNRVA